ncbi:MAG TPA: hypothetical protein VF173_01525 [Thermoanaerobaculia bacterium]|nr:hypothetical protein [Thermoanaerobaculia bacterium]
MSESEDTRRRGLKLVEPTKEELEQLDRLREGHPWQLTLRDFLSRVCSEFGYTLCEMEVFDPQGNLAIKLPYLKNPDGRVIHLPGNLAMDDMLDEITTGSLCRRMRVPPEDWGLLAEEPYDDDFDDCL